MNLKSLNLTLGRMNKNQKIIFGISATLLVVIFASAFSHNIEDDWLKGRYFFSEGVWMIWVVVVAALGWLWHKIFA